MEVVDVRGKTWKIYDKTAVVSFEAITSKSQFPIEVSLECTVLDTGGEAKTAHISLEPWGLETIEGIRQLTVSQDLLSN